MILIIPPFSCISFAKVSGTYNSNYSSYILIWRGVDVIHHTHTHTHTHTYIYYFDALSIKDGARENLGGV